MRPIRARVNAEILKWARLSAGYSQDEAARKILGTSIPSYQLARWELGEAQPTVKQLIKLARVYRRPVATFFLSERPGDVALPHDFRRLPGQVAGTYSPTLRQQIRAMEERRSIALELLSQLNDIPEPFPLHANIDYDPEALAIQIRRFLNVSFEEQLSWRDSQRYKPLREWRKHIESVGVLVFQIPDVQTSEMLGLSIAEPTLPVIAVNRKLRPNGRIFTLLHEFAHLALRHGGICDLDEFAPRRAEEQPVEIFCNRVAGAVLVPSSHFLSEPLVRQKGPGRSEWDEEELVALADRYSVSREVIIRRLLVFERTTEAFYRRKRGEYAEQIESLEAKKTEGFESPARKVVSTLGPAFVGLVLESYSKGAITLSDVSSYLGTRLKHLPKIERALGAASVEARSIE